MPETVPDAPPSPNGQASAAAVVPVAAPPAPEPASPRGPRPLRVCVLGGMAAGKTTFLAGLAVLTEPHRKHPLTLVGTEPAAVRFARDLSEALHHQQWPPATSKVTAYRYRLTLDGKLADLHWLDYPGDDFTRALQECDRDRAGLLFETLVAADAVLVLLDPDLDLRPAEELPPDERVQLLDRQRAVFSAVQQAYLERQRRAREAGRRGAPPPDVALVLTKCDRYPELADRHRAAQFVRHRLAGLWDKLPGMVGDLAVFPISAVGGVEVAERLGDRVAVPAGTIEPWGYLKLLRWTLRRYTANRDRNVRRAAAVAGALAVGGALAAGLYYAVDATRQRQIIADPQRTTIEKIEATTARHGGEARATFIDEEVSRLQGRLRQAQTTEAAEALQKELDRLSQQDLGTRAGDVDKLRAEVTRRREDLLVARLREAFTEKRPDFHTLRGQHRTAFPAGARSAEVEEMARGWTDRERGEYRARLRDLAATNVESVKEKVRHVNAYLTQFEAVEGDEARRMRTAAKLGAQFAQPNNYVVHLRRTGTFEGPQYHYVKIWVNGELRHQSPTSEAARFKHDWGGQQFTMQWLADRPIRIEMFVDGTFSDTFVAAFDDPPLPILALAGEQRLGVAINSGVAMTNATAAFEVEGITDADWQCVRDYLSPGGKW